MTKTTTPEGLAPGYRFEHLATASLRPHPENPNKGDDSALAESLNAHGFYSVVVVQAPRGRRKAPRILAGEHRWKEHQAAGHASTPCIVIDVDDDEALAIMLADNETARRAKVDRPKVGELLERLQSRRGDYGELVAEFAANRARPKPRSSTPVDDGMTRSQCKSKIDGDAAATLEAEPKPPSRPITVRGDVWQLGEHRLVCGDSHNAETLAMLTCSMGSSPRFVPIPKPSRIYSVKVLPYSTGR